MSLGKDILAELTVSGILLIFGAMLRGIYYILSDIYKLLGNKTVIITIGDFLFWIASGIGGFLVCYYTNNGNIRLFFVGICVLGAIIFDIIVKIVCWLLKKVIKKRKIQ